MQPGEHPEDALGNFFDDAVVLKAVGIPFSKEQQLCSVSAMGLLDERAVAREMVQGDEDPMTRERLTAELRTRFDSSKMSKKTPPAGELPAAGEKGKGEATVGASRGRSNSGSNSSNIKRGGKKAGPRIVRTSDISKQRGPEIEVASTCEAAVLKIEGDAQANYEVVDSSYS